MNILHKIFKTKNRKKTKNRIYMEDIYELQKEIKRINDLDLNKIEFYLHDFKINVSEENITKLEVRWFK